MLRELVLTVNPVPSRPTTFAMFAGEDDTYLVLGGHCRGPGTTGGSCGAARFIAEFAPRHALAAVRAG